MIFSIINTSYNNSTATSGCSLQGVIKVGICIDVKTRKMKGSIGFLYIRAIFKKTYIYIFQADPLINGLGI